MVKLLYAINLLFISMWVISPVINRNKRHTSPNTTKGPCRVQYSTLPETVFQIVFLFKDFSFNLLFISCLWFLFFHHLSIDSELQGFSRLQLSHPCVWAHVNLIFHSLTVAFSLIPPSLPHPPFELCRAFTVTAIAQMCILGLMWVFGAFLFQEGTTVVAYIFTILNSLQGALVFLMHCLLSKQVGYTSCMCVCNWVCIHKGQRLTQ